MTISALSVEGLSKSYRIGSKQAERSETLIGQLAQWATSPFRRRGNSEREARAEAQLHWALRDLSFNVNAGEVVGIIGHNGAGKSTLLKILSRITHPTQGIARVRGNLASLLEVGTGFHPDLSGRDNVYMNAAILGMSRQQIGKRFDDIVQFSGVEEYIDTPIKHYSSGMKVRLAFAVAAHLEPDVLIIDEVLAVGDAEFQKKCINRMEDVGSSGRTILFVSHNLSAVARLCSRVIVLDHGRMVFDGGTIEGIRHYEESLGGVRARRTWTVGTYPGDDIARLHSVELLSDGQPVAGPVDVRTEIGIRLSYVVSSDGHPIMPSVHLYDSSGVAVLIAVDTTPQWHNRPRAAGTYETIGYIPRNLLNEGQFSIAVGASSIQPFRNHFYVHDAMQFSVFDPMEGDSPCGVHRERMSGYIRPFLKWDTRSESTR